MTALMVAAINGETDVATLLLERGADRGKKLTGGKFKGKTALDLARQQNRAEIVALLEAKSGSDSSSDSRSSDSGDEAPAKVKQPTLSPAPASAASAAAAGDNAAPSSSITMPNMYEVVEKTKGDVAAMERALREGATVDDTDRVR